MLGRIGNLVSATVSVALTPIAVVVDVLTLPASAYDDRPPFERTGGLLNSARAHVEDALTTK